MVTVTLLFSLVALAVVPWGYLTVSLFLLLTDVSVVVGVSDGNTGLVAPLLAFGLQIGAPLWVIEAFPTSLLVEVPFVHSSLTLMTIMNSLLKS